MYAKDIYSLLITNIKHISMGEKHLNTQKSRFEQVFFKRNINKIK